MLVLSRRTRDSIMIGHQIVVTVLSIGRDQVRIGIQAPPEVEVHREEVYRSIQQANRLAASSSTEGLGGLVGVVPNLGQKPGASTSLTGSDPPSAESDGPVVGASRPGNGSEPKA